MAKARPKVLIVGGGVLADDVSRVLGSSGDYASVTIVRADGGDEGGVRGSRRLDLAAPRASGGVSELLTKISPDVIAYLVVSSALRDADGRSDEDAQCAEAFASGLRRWIDRGGRFKAMVALSSTAVYGVARTTPILFTEAFDVDPDEPDPDAPVAVWAEALREMENQLTAACRRAKANLCVIRAAPSIGGPIPSYIDDFISAPIPLRVFGYDPPVQTIRYPDLLDALVAALEIRPNAVLNVAGPEVTPLSRLVALTGGYALPAPAWIASLAAGSSIGSARLQWRCVADVRRAKQVLAISPRHGVQRDVNA
jgi:hypothetical protein